MTLLWVAAFSLSHHLLGETTNQKETMSSSIPSTCHLFPWPRASPRLCQEGPHSLPCPGQAPTPPALYLDRPQPPTSWCCWAQCCCRSSSTRSLQASRRKRAVITAGDTRSALASFLVTEGQTSAQRFTSCGQKTLLTISSHW